MGLKAVANPAAGGQPGSFTTLTVTGNATVGGTIAGSVTSTSINQLRATSTDGTATLRTYGPGDGDGVIINHYYAVAGGPNFLRSTDIVSTMSDTSATQMRFFTKPAGGSTAVALTLNPDQSATLNGDFALSQGKSYSALSPDGATQFSALASNGGNTDLVSYLGSGGGAFRFISGDAGGNVVVGSWNRTGLAVTGAISATGLVTADTLRVNVTPTAEVVVATHTAVFNINGTNYKFLCLAA